jgi:hypothetical protein
MLLEVSDVAKKPKKKSSGSASDLDRIDSQTDQFLEGGVDAIPAADRKRLESKATSKSPKVESDPASADLNPEPPETQPTDQDQEEPVEPATPAAGQLSIDFSEDGLEATIRAIFPATTEEEVLSFLEQQRVAHGIAEPVIKKAIQTAVESGEPVRDIVVAKGTPPRPPPPGRIEH